MLGFGGAGALARGAASLTGQGIKSLATGGAGGTAAGAFYGGLAGGVWGGVSGDTSVIGGAMMGAGLGAGIGRYGGAGAKMLKRYPDAAIGKRATAYLGAYGQMRRDYRGVSRLANQPLNKIQSTMKGWSRGITPAY